MKVRVAEETSLVVCNAKNLEVQAASVLVGGAEIPAEISANSEQEKLTLTLPQPVGVGEAVVRFKFTGVLNDKMKGFYRSKYCLDGQDR